MRLRTLLSLCSRVLFAVIVVSVLSVVLLTPVVVAGGIGVLAVSMIIVGWVYTGEGFVWQSLWAHRTGIVVVGGIVTFVRVLVPATTREIRAFRRQIAGEATQAKDTHTTVDGLTRRLAQEAGIPKPDVRVKCDSKPRSCAFGTAENGTLVVTTALVSVLSAEELEAVLAHEVSHLLNRDSRIMEAVVVPILIAEDVDATIRRAVAIVRSCIVGIMAAVALLGGVVFVAVFSVFGYLLIVTVGLDRLVSYLLVGGLVVVLPRCLLWLSKYAVAVFSRGRECAADDGAVALTGNPAALLSALRRLTDTRQRPEADKRRWMHASSAFNVLPTVEAFTQGPLRTHPAVGRRLRRLEQHVRRLESTES